MASGASSCPSWGSRSSTSSSPFSVSPRRAPMLKEFKIAALMTVVTFVLTGLVYPLALTGMAQVLFREKANGSLVTAEGRVVGSELIGQSFKQARYFQGRPSAAGTDGYDATASSASNLGPTSLKLRQRVTA